MSLLDDNFEQQFAKDLIINSVCYHYNVGPSKYTCDKFYIVIGDQVLDPSSEIDWLDMEANSHEWFIYFNYHSTSKKPKPELLISLMISKKGCPNGYMKPDDRMFKEILWYGGFEALKYTIERYLYSLNKI
jgi:hypothetical protein